MIDYKYPTIASGLIPSGALFTHPMKNYFEKTKEENFESIVGGKHHKINSAFHSHRESRFKNSTISAIALVKSKIEEIKD
jgi:hypothetical protein